jgi:hypothetical protein
VRRKSGPPIENIPAAENHDFRFRFSHEDTMRRHQAAKTNLVDQRTLARELNVTDRRVRQMVEEFILPDARDGLYDLDLCSGRYQLYRNGSERDWDRFFDQVLDDVQESSRLLDAALKPTSAMDAVTAASKAVQTTYRDMRFMTAVKSKTDSERELFFGLWKREEDNALRLLLSRACTLLGEWLIPPSRPRTCRSVSPGSRSKSINCAGNWSLRRRLMITPRCKLRMMHHRG